MTTATYSSPCPGAINPDGRCGACGQHVASADGAHTVERTVALSDARDESVLRLRAFVAGWAARWLRTGTSHGRRCTRRGGRSMPPVDLAHVRALVAEATTDPWQYREELRASMSMIVGSNIVIAGIPNPVSNDEIELLTCRANAALIAAAPSLLAAMADEIEHLRGAMHASDERLARAAARVGVVAGCDSAEWMADEIARLRAYIADVCDRMVGDMDASIERLRESNDRLRADNAAMLAIVERAAHPWLPDLPCSVGDHCTGCAASRYLDERAGR